MSVDGVQGEAAACPICAGLVPAAEILEVLPGPHPGWQFLYLGTAILSLAVVAAIFMRILSSVAFFLARNKYSPAVPLANFISVPAAFVEALLVGLGLLLCQGIPRVTGGRVPMIVALLGMLTYTIMLPVEFGLLHISKPANPAIGSAIAVSFVAAGFLAVFSLVFALRRAAIYLGGDKALIDRLVYFNSFCLFLFLLRAGLSISFLVVGGSTDLESLLKGPGYASGEGLFICLQFPLFFLMAFWLLSLLRGVRKVIEKAM